MGFHHEKNRDIIFETYSSLTAASPYYQQNWMGNETIVWILNAHCPQLKKAFNFTCEVLNRILSAKAGPFTGPNEFGLFVANIYVECPYSGKKRRVSYYFRQVNGKPPADPVSASDVADVHASTNQLWRDCIRLGRTITDQDHNTVGIGRDLSDGNTPMRAHSLKHDGSATEITPCRDQPQAGVLTDGDNGIGAKLGYDALGLDHPSIGNLPRWLSCLGLISTAERMSLLASNRELKYSLR